MRRHPVRPTARCSTGGFASTLWACTQRTDRAFRGQRLSLIAAGFAVAFGLMGLLVSYVDKSGADHKCPGGAPYSACHYPDSPWLWGQGVAIGLAVFAARTLARRFRRQ